MLRPNLVVVFNQSLPCVEICSLVEARHDGGMRGYLRLEGNARMFFGKADRYHGRCNAERILKGSNELGLSNSLSTQLALEKFRIDAEVDGGAVAVDIILPHLTYLGKDELTSLVVSSCR